MEPFSILVALFVIGLVVIAAVLAALGHSRIGNLQQRVTRLERELVSARKPEEAARAAPASVPAGPASASVAHSAPTSAPTPAPMAVPIAAAMSAAPPPTPPTTPSTTERAPAPAPSPVFAPTPPRAERPPIEWERWLGVRGAAVLGGIFLAVAGILFFKYSIERGLITPQMRVIGGAIFGSACLVGGEWMRRRRYELTANAISGAGAVILYAAFWAANQFSIVPLVVAFAAMCAVTALACWLSWRNESQLIAWLGLTGGFATPILLSSGQDHPLGLLAYLLLLDIGFLMTANRRGWSLLGLLGLAGTFTIWGLWIAERMGPATFFVALIGLGLFALLFVLLVPKKLGSVSLLSSEASVPEV